MIEDIIKEIEQLGLDPPEALRRAVGVQAGMDSLLDGNQLTGWGSGVRAEQEFTEGIATLSGDPEEAAAYLLAAGATKAAIAEAVKLHQNIKRDLQGAVDQALADSWEELVLQARPRFDAAVAALTDLVVLLGPSPTPDSVLASGDPKQAKAWREDRLAIINEVAAASYLPKLGYGRGSPRWAWYLAPDQGYGRSACAEAHDLLEAAMGDLASLVAAGFKLTLNTPTEIDEWVEFMITPDEEPEEQRSQPTPEAAELAKAWGEVATGARS